CGPSGRQTAESDSCRARLAIGNRGVRVARIRLDHAGAHQEVAETFLRDAFARILAEQGVQAGQDFRLGDVFPVQDVQAFADEVGPQAQVVAPQGAAHQGDLAQVGAGTAVGATREAQQDRRVAQAVRVQQGFQLGQQNGRVALAFGHGQPAGGQRDAGDVVAADAALSLVAVQSVFPDQRVDGGAVGFVDVGDHQILVARQAEFAFQHLGDLAHAGLQAQAVAVPQAAGSDVQPQVPAAVLAAGPAI